MYVVNDNSNTHTLYINGNIVGSLANNITIQYDTNPLRLGNEIENGVNDHYFNGKMDEVRIWNYARTTAEIQNNMYTSLVGNETGLIVNYNFDQGIPCGNNSTVTTLTDNSVNNFNGTLNNFALTTGCSSNWVRAYNIKVTATIGTLSGNYLTLKSAFDAINAGTHKGAISIAVYGNPTETATATLYQSGYSGLSSYTSVNIYPTTTGISISGNLNAPLIDLNGADNVTIDGRVNATGSTRDLTITNTSIQQSPTSTITIENDADFNTVKYCNVTGSGTSNVWHGVITIFMSTGATGNDNNTIDNCSITNAGGNRPKHAISSYGTSGKENNNLTISNCNIYNVLGAHSYIAILYSTNCLITNNSIYETASYASSSSSYIMYINGGNHTISNNFIGGSSASCGGTWIKPNTFNNIFYGIYFIGNATASNIQGNIIKNIQWFNSGNASFYGIYLNSGITNVGTTTGNTIGASTGTSSINFRNSTTGGSFYGIYDQAASSSSVISNNTIGSIQVSCNGGQYINFYGIYRAGSTCTISNNLIGSSITAKSINLDMYPILLYGIYNSSSAALSVSGNTIANMYNACSDSGQEGITAGIQTDAGVSTISGNTIYNLSNVNGFGTGVKASVMGICVNTTTNNTVTQNTIYGLANLNGSVLPVFCTTVVSGIVFKSLVGGTSVVERNFIHSLSNSSTIATAEINGISIIDGTSTYKNNIISIGSSTVGPKVNGIKDIAGTNSIYFNTISISGSQTSGTSSGITTTATNTKDIRNNIFSNTRTGGTANNAVSISSQTGLTIGYNDYIGTLSGISLNTAPDNNSIITNPSFINGASTNATDYKPTFFGNGLALGGITTDYSNITRFTTPTIGAFEVLTPDINVTGNSVSIVDGDNSPSTSDHSDFGNVLVNGNLVRTFTIQNLGTSALNISSITISGANSGLFTVGVIPSTVPAGNSATFTLTYAPVASGLHTATVTIANDDLEEAVYDFAVQGTGVTPEINLLGNAISIADGDNSPSTSDFTDFDAVLVNGNLVRTFTIQNLGTSTLNISSITMSGANSGMFTVGVIPATVPAGNSATFTVTYAPVAAGLHTATITIANDDLDETVYDFAVQGTGITPEINLQGNGVSIVVGDNSPSITDDTDFGNVLVSGNLVRTFTIQNLGTSTLNISSITMSGTNSTLFTVGGIPATVAVGNSATFTVTYAPLTAGTHTATVNISNDDLNENPYNFAITGLASATSTTWQVGEVWSNGAPTAIMSAIIDYLYNENINIVCKDLTINPGKNLEVQPTYNVTVNGNLINNGNVILKSPASPIMTASGSLITYGTITNNTGATMLAERSVIPNRYHLMASPLAASVPAINPFFMDYVWTYLEGYNWTLPGNDNDFCWAQLPTQGATVDPKVGYLVKSTSTYNSNFVIPFAGTFNTGAVSFSTLPTAYQGYNLVANPYPSAIDWNATNGWTKTGIDGTTWIWVSNGVTEFSGAYATWNGTTGVNGGSRYIPAMQGFFVKASAGNNFIMNNSVRVHSTENFKSTVNDLVKLTVSGNLMNDEIALYFADDNEDSEKFMSWTENLPQIYSIENDQKLAINKLQNVKSEQTINLGLVCDIDGNYTITANEYTFGISTTVELEDTKTGTFTTLSEGKSYSFDYSTTDAETRFVLHFNSSTVNISEPESNIEIYSSGQSIYINGISTSVEKVEIYNVIGQKVLTSELKPVIETNLFTGVYFVRIETNSQVISKKVFIQ